MKPTSISVRLSISVPQAEASAWLQRRSWKELMQGVDAHVLTLRQTGRG